MLFGVHPVTPIVTLIKMIRAVSPLPVYILSVGCSPQPNVIYAFVTLGSVLDSKQSSFRLQDEATDWLFLVCYLAPVELSI